MKIEFKRILCATDLSDFSNHAVSYAMALANQFEAVLYLCHVIDLPIVSVHGAAYTYPQDYVDSLREEAVNKLRILVGGRAIDWEPIVTTGPVANTISGLIASKGADLVIAATHGRSGLKRLILGSITERLIRTVTCPLLIVTAPEEGRDAETVQQAGFKNILVGCDFSADSGTALQYGFSLAQEYQSVLHLVHVIEPVAYREVLLPPGLLDDVRTNLDEHLTAQLEELAPEEARSWCEVKTICLTGKPFEELTKYAALHSVDLVVLGVRGRGLVETMLLGATTDRVIRRSSCPVLSVSPLKSTRQPGTADMAAAETL